MLVPVIATSNHLSTPPKYSKFHLPTLLNGTWSSIAHEQTSSTTEVKNDFNGALSSISFSRGRWLLVQPSTTLSYQLCIHRALLSLPVMSFDHSRSLIRIPRRSSSARRYRYPEYRDCEFGGYYDHGSRLYDWVSKTSLERANLNRPRTQSVPRSLLQDPDYQCKRDLGWNIDYATTFLVDRLEKADSHNSGMAADILSRVRAVSHGTRDSCSKHTENRYCLPGIQCPQ